MSFVSNLLLPVKTMFSAIGGILKWVFFIACFLLVCAIILGNMGGSNDNLKKMMENYISQASGYPTRIAKLNEFRFFPTIVADLSGIEIVNPKSDTLMGSVEHIDVRMSFMSAVLGNGDVKAVTVKNAVLAKGLLLNKSVRIQNAEIKELDAESNRAALVAEGQIGDDAFTASLDMEALGEGRSRRYRMPQDRSVTARLGEYEGQARFVEGGKHDLSVLGIKATQDGRHLVSGDVFIDVSLLDRHISGDLRLGEVTRVQPDVTIAADGKVSGVVTLPKAAPQEFAVLGAAVAKLQEKLAPAQAQSAPKGIELSALNLDLTVDIQELLLNDRVLGKQRMTILADKGALRILAKDGEIAKGRSFADIHVKPLGDESGTHKVALDIKSEKLSVGDLLTILDGKSNDIKVSLDSSVNLNAQVTQWDQLPARLSGDVALVTTEGAFESRWLNVWGDGLTSILLPSLRPSEEAKLNCAVMHADIKDGRADLQEMFLDAKRVRLKGTGGYDILSDNLDIKLSPKTKDISFGDISASVHLKGSASNPKVRADALETGKKAAGLLLGAVNPAFLALSTDLGITSKEKAQADLCPAITALKGANKAESFVQRVK